LLVYDGAQMVQSWSSDGVLRWSATWGPGLDSLVSMERQGVEYFALDDGKGNVVGWLDGSPTGPTSNTVVARAEYTPEGRGRLIDVTARTECVESGATRCASQLGLPFGFHSAFVAQESHLLYFRNRWYSPEANQWLSQDPLDAVDSFDLYAFNAFDSVNLRDPMGLRVGDVTTIAVDDGAFDPLDPNGPVTPGSGRRVVRSKCGVDGCVDEPDSPPAEPSQSCKGPICQQMGSAGSRFADASPNRSTGGGGGGGGAPSVSGRLAKGAIYSEDERLTIALQKLEQGSPTARNFISKLRAGQIIFRLRVDNEIESLGNFGPTSKADEELLVFDTKNNIGQTTVNVVVLVNLAKILNPEEDDSPVSIQRATEEDAQSEVNVPRISPDMRLLVTIFHELGGHGTQYAQLTDRGFKSNELRPMPGASLPLVPGATEARSPLDMRKQFEGDYHSSIESLELRVQEELFQKANK
jgi:RHS repeat-associated protein